MFVYIGGIVRTRTTTHQEQTTMTTGNDLATLTASTGLNQAPNHRIYGRIFWSYVRANVPDEWPRNRDCWLAYERMIGHAVRAVNFLAAYVGDSGTARTIRPCSACRRRRLRSLPRR